MELYLQTMGYCCSSALSILQRCKEPASMDPGSFLMS